MAVFVFTNVKARAINLQITHGSCPKCCSSPPALGAALLGHLWYREGTISF